MTDELFQWREAFEVANTVRLKLEPHCEQVLVVGSLRRQCLTVHDIDIVLCPKPGELQGFVSFELQRILGDSWQWIKGKSKIVNGRTAGIPIDLYFATPQNWWTLVVIRTGSKGHNIRLCSRAKALGMKLHADGSGIDLDDGTLFMPQSEEDIFQKLQLDYVEPNDRK